MPNRTQVADLAGPEALQPQSQAVQGQTTPNVARPRPVNAQLGDLAQALQDIQPSLARFNQTSMALNIQEGHALAAKNKVAFKEAVDKGIIKPGQNPWLAKGYKEQILSLQAQDYDSTLRQAWTKSGVSESDDPLAFKKFVDGFSQTYVDKMDLKGDPTFAQVFAPKMVASQANLLDQHTVYQQERIVQKATDATYRNIQGKISAHYLYADDAHLGADIKQTVDSMVASGLPGAKANKLMVDAIRDKAIQDGDATVLGLMKHITTNAGPLDKTQYAVEQTREAEQHIFTLQREKDSQEWSNHERNKKLIGEDLLRQAYTRIGQDPTSDISDILKQAEFADPEKAKTIREYKDYVLTTKDKVYAHPQETAELYQHIYSGTCTPTEIISMANQKKLTDEQVTFAFRDMDAANHHRDVLDNPAINKVCSEIDRVITHNGTQYDNSTGLQSLDAQNTLKQGVIDYHAAHPNASSTEMYEESVRLQKIVLQGIPETASVGTHVTPATAGRVQKEVGTEPAAPKAAVSKPLYTTPDDLKQAIEEYNSTQGGGRLAIQAEALGMSIPELIKAQKAHFAKPTK